MKRGVKGILNAESSVFNFMRSRSVKLFRPLAAALFMVAGIFHFLMPASYIKMVPPGFPSPGALVWVSGLFEILGGAGLLLPITRKLAGWGLIALLIAVFPANIYMALHPELFGLPPWLLWARLPMQLVLGAWVWSVSLKSSS